MQPSAQHLPPALRQRAETVWADSLSELPAHARRAIGQAAQPTAQGLKTLWACSEFAARYCRRRPEALVALLEDDRLDRAQTRADFDAQLAALDASPDAQSLAAGLRHFRNANMLRILWREFVLRAPYRETLAELSHLADACIESALNWHHRELCAEWGVPKGENGGEIRMSALGLGKLGGGELNLSSDVDLILCYAESGHTEPVVERPAKSRSNQEFFVRLGQRLVQALDEQTAEGFVFRIDLRLRPYGREGVIAASFAAIEEYYQTQGRDWERYALIKARPVAGDLVAGAQLLECLRGFVYRRYLDFSAIEALRTMRQMIEREAGEQALRNDLKLGFGGIRECEFIVQSLQLIYGGREPAMQRHSFLKALDAARDTGVMQASDHEAIARSYRLLRMLENAIQGWNDQQTQRLPETPETIAALAWRAGHPDEPALREELAQSRERVNQIFRRLIAPPGEDENAPAADWRSAWESAPERPDALNALIAESYEDPEEILPLLFDLRRRAEMPGHQAQGLERFHRFMPKLLSVAGRCARPSAALKRCLPVISTTLRRSTYLVLLEENPAVLKSLVDLCLASPWVASELTRMPLLFDELLETRPPNQAFTAQALGEQLDSMLRAARLRARDDLEQQLEEQIETLRQFKTSQTMSLAVRQLAGGVDAQEASAELAAIAEACLTRALPLARETLAQRHGSPALPQTQNLGFLIIAYGKLGSRELGYRSDLDLSFVCGGEPHGQTDGAKPLDNATFFTRLGQRFIHFLNARTRHGLLYEIDTRLRPSGQSGPLVVTMDSFEAYLRDSAWTWEHQALVCSRPLAGDAELSGRFERLRKSILCQPRETDALREEIVAMRKKMRAQSTRNDVPLQALKQQPGGIVDIEFIVQYLILARAHDFPVLCERLNHPGMLASLARCGALNLEDANALREAWLALREAAQGFALRDATVADFPQVAPLTEKVAAIWRQLFER